MRTSNVATVWLLSPVLVLLAATACSGSVATAAAPVEEPTDSATSLVDAITEALEADLTETPETDLTETSKTDLTETSKADLTEMQETDLTEAPETDLKEMPETDLTETPETDLTETPETDLTETPETDLTEAPEAETDQRQASDTTEVPEPQLVDEEEEVALKLREGGSESSAPEQDDQVTGKPVILDGAQDARSNFDSISDDDSSEVSEIETEEGEEGEEGEGGEGGGGAGGGGGGAAAALKSDAVNYDGWTVLKVGGFSDGVVGDSNVEVDDTLNVQDDLQAVGVRSQDPDSEYPLMDLEEREGVKVLQENKLGGFYEVAVSPTELEAVISDLKARGLEVEDRDINLGTLIAETTLPSIRKDLAKGDVTFDSYMTYEEIEAFIMAFADEHPHTVSREVIGTTVEGRDIHMLTLSMGGRHCRSLGDDSSSNENEGSQRESRQVDRIKDSSPSAAQEAMDALARIIRWSDLRDREALRLKNDSLQQQQQEEVQAQQGEDESTEGIIDEAPLPLMPEEETATHMLLEKIMQNIPYDYQFDSEAEDNRTGKDTIRNTYDALQEIMSNDNVNSEDYVYLDSADQPEAVQLTFKVLQRIINFNPSNRKRKPYQNSPHEDLFNRISKSLKSANANATDPVSANKTTTNDQDLEADILFLLSTFIPKEYAKNATIVEALKQSLIIISKLLPKDGNLTQEVIDKLAPQIVNLPGVVGVSSDGSNSSNDLVVKLVHLIRAREGVNRNNPMEEAKLTDPVLKMSQCKPVIFIDGGIHAREWISPAFLLYTLKQLVANTPLLLGAEWRLVPVLNPDGYVHTWTTDRLWRKNKSKQRRCPGVDLNRNFGHRFGGVGTSTNKCSDIYRGTEAFSEPESQALKAAVESVKDRLKAYVSVHSYGQMILHPWGYSPSRHPNDEQLHSMGSGMAQAIRDVYGTEYVVGSAARILYSAAGGSDDWVSSLGVPYSFTMELRDEGRNGFVLPAGLIWPTVKETWAGIEYLGNRVINESPRSASPAVALTAEQAAQGTFLNTIGSTGPIPGSGQRPVGVYPFAPLVPLVPGFGVRPAFSGSVTPTQYSAAMTPIGAVPNHSARVESPAPQTGPFQFAPSFNIPQTVHYYNPGYQPLQAQPQQPFAVTPQRQATHDTRTNTGARPTFSDSLPNVSILGNQQANVHLTPFGLAGQSSPYDFAFAQNQVQGNAPLLPVYPNAFYSPQASSPNPYASFRIPEDENVGDDHIVNYLGQVLSSLYQNEALSSSAGSNSPAAQQGYLQNYDGTHPTPVIVQHPFWSAPLPQGQTVYNNGDPSNPPYAGNSNVFIPYNSPMVVRPSTDFNENQQFPLFRHQIQDSPSPDFGQHQQFQFSNQQIQNPEQNVHKFQPATLAQFLHAEENSNSFSSPAAGFQTTPQFSPSRPIEPSPSQPSFKTNIQQVFRQNPNDYIEEQRLRHRLNAEYHKNSPVLVSLANPYNEQSPSYSNRFDFEEGEIGELSPIMSYHRSLGGPQERYQQRFNIPQEYRQ